MKWGGREKYPAVGRRSSRCRLRRVVLSWQYFSLHCVFSLWVWAAPASPDRRWMAAAALTPLGTNASTLRYWWHGITTEQAAGMQLRGSKITYMLPVINVSSWFMTKPAHFIAHFILPIVKCPRVHIGVGRNRKSTLTGICMQRRCWDVFTAERNAVFVGDGEA